jgi:hypothetical protein
MKDLKKERRGKCPEKFLVKEVINPVKTDFVSLAFRVSLDLNITKKGLNNH